MTLLKLTNHKLLKHQKIQGHSKALIKRQTARFQKQLVQKMKKSLILVHQKVRKRRLRMMKIKRRKNQSKKKKRKRNKKRRNLKKKKLTGKRQTCSQKKKKLIWKIYKAQVGQSWSCWWSIWCKQIKRLSISLMTLFMSILCKERWMVRSGRTSFS